MKKVAHKLPLLVVLLAVGGLLVYGFWPVPIQLEVVKASRGQLQVTVEEDGQSQSGGG